MKILGTKPSFNHAVALFTEAVDELKAVANAASEDISTREAIIEEQFAVVNTLHTERDRALRVADRLDTLLDPAPYISSEA